MVNEHKKLVDTIQNNLSSIKDNNDNYLIYTLNYLEENEYSAIELMLYEHNILSETFIVYKILGEIKKNDIVLDIYTIEDYKSFVIHLLPISEIRQNKLNRLKNKLKLTD
ncbi:MAG: hypothetical protein ACOC3V_00760 [bacterium]